ncbi:hypothetical protein ACB316_17085 [Aeromonas sanarellii]
MKISWATLLVARHTKLLGTQKESLSTDQRLKQSKLNNLANKSAPVDSRQNQANTVSKPRVSESSSPANLQLKQLQPKPAVAPKQQEKARKSMLSVQETAQADSILTQAVLDFIATAIPGCIDDYLRSLTLLTVNMQVAKGLSDAIVKTSRMQREGQINDGVQ